MRKLIYSGLVAVALSLGCTVASAQSSQHFVISASAAGYNGQSGTQAVSLEGAAFQLTTNVSLGAFQLSNPTDSSAPVYRMGVANYTRELKALVGSKLASKVAFDLSNYLVTFQAGGGKVSYKGVNRIAEVGGVFLTRPVANNIALTCGYQVFHGQGFSVVTRRNSGTPTVGINFTF